MAGSSQSNRRSSISVARVTLFLSMQSAARRRRACVAKIDSYDAILGEESQKQLKIKAHVAAPWIVALARNPKILDAVEFDRRAEYPAVRRIDVLQEGAGQPVRVVASGRGLLRPRSAGGSDVLGRA